MDGKLVNAVSPLDSVRLEILGGSRAVSIPSSLLVAVDDVMRAAVHLEEEFSVYDCEDDAGWSGWEATLGHFCAQGNTPWNAIKALADKVAWDGREVRGTP